jgi:hypothetical protein
MATNHDGNVNYGTPPTMSCGQVTLYKDDTLTLGIGTGFTGTWDIVMVTFYDSVNGQQGPNIKGVWKRSPQTPELPTGLSATQTTQGVVFADTGSNQRYYYTVTVSNGTDRLTTTDPELVIRKSSGPGED